MTPTLAIVAVVMLALLAATAAVMWTDKREMDRRQREIEEIIARIEARKADQRRLMRLARKAGGR